MKIREINEPGERKKNGNKRKGASSLKRATVWSCGLTRAQRDDCNGKIGKKYCPDCNRCTHRSR